MKITNIDVLNDLAKNALRHKTAFVNRVTTYREFQRNALIELLKKAGLDNCYVIYEYGKNIEGDPFYVRGELTVEPYTESSDMVNPYIVVFNGGCVEHRFSLEQRFLTDDEDYFSYLINEVFPKLKRREK